MMVMGAFIPGLRRKYPFQEYVSAVMLVIGLILFTLADAQTSPNFSMVGVAMVSGALVMDAFLGHGDHHLTMLSSMSQVLLLSKKNVTSSYLSKKVRSIPCHYSHYEVVYT